MHPEPYNGYHVTTQAISGTCNIAANSWDVTGLLDSIRRDGAIGTY